MVVLMVLITFAARLSGRVGRKPLMTAGCISLVVLSVPAFLLIEPGSYTMIFPGVLFIGFMPLCFSSTTPSVLPALFPTDVGNGSLAVAFNITVAVFGSTTPLIAEVLGRVLINSPVRLALRSQREGEHVVTPAKGP
jgi:MHS family proline/betaine transporter-like MFS transporter